MKFNLSCPVELNSLVINEETQTAEATFFNLSQQTITAMKYTLVLFDENGEKTAETPAELEGIDLKPREAFSSVIAAEGAADADVVFTEVTFEDETVFAVSDEEIEITYEELSEADMSRFERAGAPDACCFAKEEDAFWLCVCGRPNLPSSESCIRCQREKDAVMTDFATEQSVAMTIVKKEELDALEAERAAAEKAEEEAERKELRNKKLKKAGIVAAIAIVAVIILYFIFKLIVTGIGDSSAKEGDYAKAYSMYNLAGNSDKIDEIADRVYGNSVSNLLSSGILAQDDENIYYVSLDSLIHKQNKETGETTAFEDAYGMRLNASGGWLYYIDSQGTQNICKISPDGATREVVYDSPVYYMQTVVNDIYFIADRIESLDANDPSATEKSSAPLYVLKEGKTEPQLVSDAEIAAYTVYKDRIYYIDYTDTALYSMNLSGKDTKKLIEGPIYRFDIKDNKIYYSVADSLESEASGSSNVKLFASDLNGKNAEPLLKDISVLWFTLSADSLYYMDSNQEGTICKYTPDGESTVELENISNINISEDTILYIAADEELSAEDPEAAQPDLKMYLTKSDKSGYDVVSSLNEILASQPAQTEAPPADMPTP